MSSLADFKQLCLLGKGAYSAVYKVMRLADREVYALKKVKMPSLSDKEKQNALNEVRLLASVQHENVVAYKEAFFDDKTRCLCIVQECADAGDLLQQINKCKQERSYIQEADVWRYFEGMAMGLKALHDMHVLHRDMKSANIFISQPRDGGGGPIAKLGDFNVSKVAKRGLCMTQTGTPYYASPEVWRDMPYDAKSDMWSLGCVLYEMVALRPPFRAEDMEGLYRKVVRGQYPRIPSHYSQELAEVIQALLQVHPRHRPTVDQLLLMPCMERNGSGAARQSPGGGKAELLGTIKMPKNPIDLCVALPKPRYTMSQPSLPEEESNAGSSPLQSAYSRSIRETAGDRPQEHPRSGLPEKRQSTASAPGLPSIAEPTIDPTRALPSRRGVPAEVPRRQLQTPVPSTGSRTPMRGDAQRVREVGDSLDAYLQGQHGKEDKADGLGGQGSPQPSATPVVYSREGRQHGARPALHTSQSRPHRLCERRPLSIYALQQYTVVDQAQQQVEAQKEANAARRQRPLLPQLH